MSFHKLMLVFALVLAQVQSFVVVPVSKTTTRRSILQPLELALIDEVAGAYTWSLTNYQLATESATSALLAGLGDVAAQLQEQKGIDWRRYRIFCVKGSVFGILWSNWYAFCDPTSLSIVEHLSLDSAATIPVQLFISILLEQFVWCPIIYSLWDIPFPMLLRGDAID